MCLFLFIYCIYELNVYYPLRLVNTWTCSVAFFPANGEKSLNYFVIFGRTDKSKTPLETIKVYL